MNTLIGLLIIAVGSFGQSSSYVPIKKSGRMVVGKFLAGARNLCMARLSAVGRTACHSGGKLLTGTLGGRRRFACNGLRRSVGRGWTDIRFEYALSGCSTRTEYCPRYVRRFRNTFPSFVCRKRLASW